MQSKDAIISELEKRNKTIVSIKNANIDISEAVTKRCSEFDLHSGSQTVEVTTTIDKSKVKSLVEKGVVLREFEKLDYDKLYSMVKAEVVVDCSDCVTLKYKQEDIDKYLKVRDWYVSYTNNLTFKKAGKYVKLTKNGIKYDYSWLEDFISKVDSKYTTYGKPIKVKTFSGGNKTIKSNMSSWGIVVDKETEYKTLKKAFTSGKVLQNRYPSTSQNYGNIGKTRIEVSLTHQKLYYYKKGKLKKTSSVVTGNTSAGHGTPKGVYFISERVPGKYLVGDGYRTWVNRWMRLTNTGVGLHDASWRGSFGGSIYTYNGSHGCINLPSSFAYSLYPVTYIGMPVIVY